MKMLNKALVAGAMLILPMISASAQQSNKTTRSENSVVYATGDYDADADTLDASRVSTDRLRLALRTQTGLTRLDSKKFNSGFALFNSPDIIKTIQRLPGVASGTELLSGLYVHGGTGSDNLFLLDGVPLYSTSHLIGLFSSFNADVVEDVDFYKSGFPARYGGRLSSVVDVNTRPGNMYYWHGSFSLGLIDGRFQIDGPQKYSIKAPSPLRSFGNLRLQCPQSHCSAPSCSRCCCNSVHCYV